MSAVLQAQRTSTTEFERPPGATIGAGPYVSQLDALISASESAIIILSAEGLVVSWNPAAEQLLGYRAEEMIGRGIENLVPPMLASHLEEERAAAADGRSLHRKLTKRLSKDGRVLDVAIDVLPVIGNDGKTHRVIKILRDQSARLDADSYLRLLAETSALVESSPDLQTTLDKVARLGLPDLADWTVVHLFDDERNLVGRACAHVDPDKMPALIEVRDKYPYSRLDDSGTQRVARTGIPELLTGLNDETLARKVVDPYRRQLLAKIGVDSALCIPLIANGGIIGAITYCSVDSTRLYSPRDMAAAREVAGRGALAIANAMLIERTVQASNEINQLNEALEVRIEERTAELLRSNLELQTANRELESFSYSVSHDLRAPLRAMDGFARILSERYGEMLPEEGQRYLARVRHNATQMGSLVDDLLALSRLGRHALSKRTVSPGDLVRQILHELDDERQSRGIEIILTPLPDCLADAVLLKQAFFNLISNAFKFTRSRANPRVEIAWRPDPTQSSGGWYVVRDNGVGFDMTYASKLFGVFQRLHRAEEFEGTGVGLAIVHRILQRHGGTIVASAELDRGAEFAFSLPCD